MADNNSITGSVVGKVRFNIDKKSWDNLELFQKKLTSIKKQMSTMDKTIKVQAVVQSINKVTNATVNAENKIVKAREANVKKVERADTAYDKRRERLLNTRAKLNNARRKRHSGAASASEAYAARVEAFSTVKRNQIEKTALMRGWSDSQKETAHTILNNNIKKFQGQFDGSKSGDIGNFRANVNGAVNQLSAMDAVARRSAISLKSLRNELVQLTAAYTAFSVVQNVAQTGFEFESLRASARVFAKDDAGVANHMAFISEQAQRLGIDLQTATKEFTKFSIATQTTMSKADQRELFVGMSEYSRVLGLSKQDYERAFRAVQQMASKGQLTI